MPWLRVDDAFATHPKLLALPRTDRWTWIEILCYCARYNTDGEVPTSIGEAVPKATRAFLHKCVEIGLLDPTDEPSLTVHDWHIYNGQHIEDRVNAYLEANPESSANEVAKAIGGGRKQVLRAVRDWYDRTTPNGTETGTKPGPHPVSGAAARARSRPLTQPQDPKTRDVTGGSNASGRRRAAIKPPALKTVDQAIEGRKQ